MKADWSSDNLRNIAEKSFSKKEILISLNIRNAGSNLKTLNKYLELYNIDISHFKKKNKNTNKLLLSEILESG